jgi:hypothetical protein
MKTASVAMMSESDRIVTEEGVPKTTHYDATAGYFQLGCDIHKPEEDGTVYINGYPIAIGEVVLITHPHCDGASTYNMYHYNQDGARVLFWQA